jgi:hypothetical protein
MVPCHHIAWTLRATPLKTEAEGNESKAERLAKQWLRAGLKRSKLLRVIERGFTNNNEQGSIGKGEAMIPEI